MNLQYKLIRSGRKTIALEIRGQEILVRAPYSVPKRVIETFVLEKREWIEKKLQRPENRQNRADSADLLTEAEISRLRMYSLPEGSSATIWMIALLRPERTKAVSARLPSARLTASMTTDLPAPVSPVIMLSPSLKSISTFSMMAKFLILMCLIIGYL